MLSSRTRHVGGCTIARACASSTAARMTAAAAAAITETTTTTTTTATTWLAWWSSFRAATYSGLGQLKEQESRWWWAPLTTTIASISIGEHHIVYHCIADGDTCGRYSLSLFLSFSLSLSLFLSLSLSLNHTSHYGHFPALSIPGDALLDAAWFLAMHTCRRYTRASFCEARGTAIGHATTRHSTARHGTARHGAARRGVARRGAAPPSQRISLRIWNAQGNFRRRCFRGRDRGYVIQPTRSLITRIEFVEQASVSSSFRSFVIPFLPAWTRVNFPNDSTTLYRNTHMHALLYMRAHSQHRHVHMTYVRTHVQGHVRI